MLATGYEWRHFNRCCHYTSVSHGILSKWERKKRRKKRRNWCHYEYHTVWMMWEWFKLLLAVTQQCRIEPTSVIMIITQFEWVKTVPTTAGADSHTILSKLVTWRCFYTLWMTSKIWSAAVTVIQYCRNEPPHVIFMHYEWRQNFLYLAVSHAILSK